MLHKYIRIIDKIKDQVFFLIDDDENENVIIGKDFMIFRFKTNDNLPYNKTINVKFCVISINSVFKESNWYYPQIELQDCFYENSDYD